MDAILDAFHLRGVYFINFLQTYFPSSWQQDLFLIFSHIGDPKNAFVFYFPLVFTWKKCEGRRLLMAAVGSEWLNLILKWCLRGERPYWWVYESKTNLTLKQFYLTCETGPGSPSGHVMVTCAVGVFLVLVVLTHQQSTTSLGMFLRIAPWCLYFAIVFLVSLSRIYIAAHFPHQIILAFVLGNLIGSLIWKDATNRPSKFYLLLSASLLLFSLLFYNFLLLFSNPGFSIPKAMKYCANKEFIKLDTTPFYVIVRDSGAILGVGVSQLLQIKASGTTNNNCLSLSKVFQAMLSIFSIRCLEHIPFLDLHPPILFYLIGFLKSSVLVVIVMIVVPFIVNCLCKIQEIDFGKLRHN